ncbi:nuclear import protein Mog1p [[Candida] railenensis]|uniref:Nuclear import protein Mog1p n=1 Tax=[Candida] railenensis TaxID=45579 RepID=A0A9P0QN63_9ASCO|nr:nuclear import protein Mog1p [[Candida] railenensis]
MPFYPLYGGAVATELPSEAIDVSQIREIPDTQEVFIIESKQNDPKLDSSIIFDLLESVQANTVEELLQLHIKEISEDVEKPTTSYQTIRNDSLNQDAYFTYFIQKSPKRDKYSSVTLIGLIQLKKVDTDVLISVNVPFIPSAQELLTQEGIERDLSDSSTSIGKGYKLLKSATANYTVKDWQLFG